MGETPPKVGRYALRLKAWLDANEAKEHKEPWRPPTDVTEMVLTLLAEADAAHETLSVQLSALTSALEPLPTFTVHVYSSVDDTKGREIVTVELAAVRALLTAADTK